MLTSGWVAHVPRQSPVISPCSRRSTLNESMHSFLENERRSAMPKVCVNDVTLNDSHGQTKQRKKISFGRNCSTSSGYGSALLEDSKYNASNELSDHDQSFYDAEMSVIEELQPKTDLQLFRPTQNEAFRQNVIDCSGVDVDEGRVDDLNSTLERVDFILDCVGYEPKRYAENENRRRLLKEFGQQAVAADKENRKRTMKITSETVSGKRRAIGKRTISLEQFVQ